MQEISRNYQETCLQAKLRGDGSGFSSCFAGGGLPLTSLWCWNNIDFFDGHVANRSGQGKQDTMSEMIHMRAAGKV